MKAKMQNKHSIKSLIIAELDGEISVQDKEQLYNWIAKSEVNTRYYTHVKDLWEASLANASELAQTKQEWKRFTNRIVSQSDRKNRKIYLNTWLKVASVIVIGLLISNVVIKNFKNPEPVYATSVAPEGSVSQTILPDGTLVYLNAGTKLKFDVNTQGKKREVFINGEAWFDVSKNKNKPFVVHTAYYDVKVLGTQFNVKAYEDDDEVVTTLEEGSVQLNFPEATKTSENLILKPGEQLVFNKTKRKYLLKFKIDTKLYTSWKDNKLIFLEMPFGELVQLLERKFGVEIIVDDESILGEHFTGTIKNESILEILNIIQHTHPIKYNLDGQKIIIQKK